jgi:hypothetical protein
MDGKLLDGAKQWTCKNNHLLGIIEQAVVSGKSGKYHVSRLILFRQAIDLNSAVSLADVDVIGNIEGTVMDIRCSVPGCGEVRTWWMGAASLERFLEARKEKVRDGT